MVNCKTPSFVPRNNRSPSGEMLYSCGGWADPFFVRHPVKDLHTLPANHADRKRSDIFPRVVGSVPCLAWRGSCMVGEGMVGGNSLLDKAPEGTRCLVGHASVFSSTSNFLVPRRRYGSPRARLGPQGGPEAPARQLHSTIPVGV